MSILDQTGPNVHLPTPALPALGGALGNGPLLGSRIVAGAVLTVAHPARLANHLRVHKSIIAYRPTACNPRFGNGAKMTPASVAHLRRAANPSGEGGFLFDFVRCEKCCPTIQFAKSIGT